MPQQYTLQCSVAAVDVTEQYISGYRDKDGDIWLTGRVDDVMNVSGHRIGTAEVHTFSALFTSYLIF